MKKSLKILSVITAVALVLLSFSACSSEPADPTVPQVEKAIRINATDVEIYFADGYTGTDQPDVTQFAVTDGSGNAV